MNKSFTLIEILVVIVVIGILSVFILVGMSSITNSANVAKSKAFLNSMDNSLLLARVSQWKLDESSGITVYDSWGTNNGTRTDTTGACDATHCPQIQTSGCVSNNCLFFDGTNDYVGFSHSSDHAGPSITVAGWVKTFSVHDWILVDKYRTEVGGACGWYIYGYVSGAYTVSSWVIWNNGVSSYLPFNQNFSNDVWYYLVGTFDSATSVQKNYINGVQKNTATGKSLGITTALGVRIGGQAQSLWTHGSIDDVLIYNQAIPTSQIEQNYFVGINKLFKNNGITLEEFDQRLIELKNNLANN